MAKGGEGGGQGKGPKQTACHGGYDDMRPPRSDNVPLRPRRSPPPPSCCPFFLVDTTGLGARDWESCRGLGVPGLVLACVPERPAALLDRRHRQPQPLADDAPLWLVVSRRPGFALGRHGKAHRRLGEENIYITTKKLLLVVMTLPAVPDAVMPAWRRGWASPVIGHHHHHRHCFVADSPAKAATRHKHHQ